MKTTQELRATLKMILTRLDDDPRSADEWQVIQNALYDSLGYATKVKIARKRETHPAYCVAVDVDPTLGR